MAGVLLAPVLYAVGRSAMDGHLVRAPVPWRSSAPGADLLAFALPNPAHPLAPEQFNTWLEARPNGYVDNVVSLSWVAIAVIILAWWRTGLRPRRFWLFVTFGFGLLALGPFVHVAGINTYIPTPWALLRYVPVIEAARMPSRFAVIVVLGLSMLFASALVTLGGRYPQYRTRMIALVGVLLAFELLPVPRTLHSAAIPAIYDVIAADPRPVRVLELPFGIRDGLSSMGDYTAASQFYQTHHHKPLIGGYLSRVSPKTKSLRAAPGGPRTLCRDSPHSG
jgi:hypothetical protein